MVQLNVLLLNCANSSFIEPFENTVKLQALDYNCVAVGSPDELKKALEATTFDAAIAEFLPGCRLVEALANLQNLPVIVLASENNMETAIKETHTNQYTLYIIKDTRGSYLNTLPAILENMKKNREAGEEAAKETGRMETALQEANEKLIIWVNELEQRGSEIFLLSEMADLLQTCYAPDEAFAVIAESMKKLFPNDSGGLCLLNDAVTGVDVVASWGDVSALKQSFLPKECWALRRGKIHIVEDTHTGLLCQHVSKSFSGSYFCIPMMAQGESLGMLYLQSNPGEFQQPQEVRKLLVESKQRLAMTVAEHIALSLANIKLRETLRYQAIRDPLTTLFNRRYLEDTMEREMHQAKRENAHIGIIMLDIDHFKKFNDTYGHGAGDALLTGLGNFLKNNIRGGDIPCRYGGEEFILILLGASLEETAKRAEILRQGVKKLEIKYEENKLPPITISLGVACFQEHGSTVTEILRSADYALYQAKAEGRDKVVMFKSNK